MAIFGNGSQWRRYCQWHASCGDAACTEEQQEILLHTGGAPVLRRDGTPVAFQPNIATAIAALNAPVITLRDLSPVVAATSGQLLTLRA